MATRGWPAAVIHNGAHLFVISSRRSDSRKQRTGYGRRGTKSNPFDNRSTPESTLLAGVAAGIREGRGLTGERVPRCCCSLARSRGGERTKDGRRGGGGEMPGITCSEESVSPSFLFRFRGKLPVNARASVDLRREQRCRFSKEIERDRRSLVPVSFPRS